MSSGLVLMTEKITLAELARAIFERDLEETEDAEPKDWDTPIVKAFYHARAVALFSRIEDARKGK
jgi:hypothetical protein